MRNHRRRPLPAALRPLRLAATLSCLAALTGCGTRTVHERGTGASGEVETVEEEFDHGLELVNRLTEEQQVWVDYFEQPFDAVAEVTEFGKRPENAELLAKIREEWDRAGLADPLHDRRTYYVVTLQTSVENLYLPFQAWFDYAPNHARALVALARAGHYDGMELALDGDAIRIGSADTQPLFTLEPEPLEQAVVPFMTALAVPIGPDGRSDLSGMRMHHGRPQEFIKELPTVTLAGVPVPGDPVRRLPDTQDVVQQLTSRLARSTEPITIVRALVLAESTPLFDREGVSLNMPPMDGDRPRLPEFVHSLDELPPDFLNAPKPEAAAADDGQEASPDGTTPVQEEATPVEEQPADDRPTDTTRPSASEGDRPTPDPTEPKPPTSDQPKADQPAATAGEPVPETPPADQPDTEPPAADQPKR